MTSPPTLETNEQDLRRRARKRVNLKLGFMTHLAVYVVVNAGMLLLDRGVGGHRWSLWPLAGWGLGLAIHGLATLAALRGEGLRERMVAREVDRLRRGD